MFASNRPILKSFLGSIKTFLYYILVAVEYYEIGFNLPAGYIYSACMIFYLLCSS